MIVTENRQKDKVKGQKISGKKCETQDWRSNFRISLEFVCCDVSDKKDAFG